jgi:hypothetical protein
VHTEMNVFCPLYTMTAYGESRGKTPLIFNLGTGWDEKPISRPCRSPLGIDQPVKYLFIRDYELIFQDSTLFQCAIYCGFLVRDVVSEIGGDIYGAACCLHLHYPEDNGSSCLRNRAISEERPASFFTILLQTKR